VPIIVSARCDHGHAQQPQLFKYIPTVAAAVASDLPGYSVQTNNRDADFQPGLDTHKDNQTYEESLRDDFELNEALLSFTTLTDLIAFRMGIPLDALSRLPVLILTQREACAA
jgi:hypothetical protein